MSCGSVTNYGAHAHEVPYKPHLNKGEPGEILTLWLGVLGGDISPDSPEKNTDHWLELTTFRLFNQQSTTYPLFL